MYVSFQSVMQRRVNPKVVDEIWIFRAWRLTRCDAKWNEATRHSENGVVWWWINQSERQKRIRVVLRAAGISCASTKQIMDEQTGRFRWILFLFFSFRLYYSVHGEPRSAYNIFNVFLNFLCSRSVPIDRDRTSGKIHPSMHGKQYVVRWHEKQVLTVIPNLSLYRLHSASVLVFLNWKI